MCLQIINGILRKKAPSYVGSTYISSLSAFSPLLLKTAAQLDTWGIVVTVFSILCSDAWTAWGLADPGGTALPEFTSSWSARIVHFSNENQSIQSPHPTNSSTGSPTPGLYADPPRARCVTRDSLEELIPTSHSSACSPCLAHPPCGNRNTGFSPVPPSASDR